MTETQRRRKEQKLKERLVDDSGRESCIVYTVNSYLHSPSTRDKFHVELAGSLSEMMGESMFCGGIGHDFSLFTDSMKESTEV